MDDDPPLTATFQVYISSSPHKRWRMLWPSPTLTQGTGLLIEVVFLLEKTHHRRVILGTTITRVTASVTSIGVVTAKSASAPHAPWVDVTGEEVLWLEHEDIARDLKQRMVEMIRKQRSPPKLPLPTILVVGPPIPSDPL